MGAHIDIDENLLRRAMRATDLPTKKAVIEEGLRLLVKLHRHKAVLSVGGKAIWRAKLPRASTGGELGGPRMKLVESTEAPTKRRGHLKIIK